MLNVMNPQYQAYLNQWRQQNPNYGQPGYVGSQPLNMNQWQQQQGGQQGNWWQNEGMPWAGNQQAMDWFNTPEGQQWLQGRDQNTGGFSGARTTEFRDNNQNGIDDRDEPWNQGSQGGTPGWQAMPGDPTMPDWMKNGPGDQPLWRPQTGLIGAEHGLGMGLQQGLSGMAGGYDMARNDIMNWMANAYGDIGGSIDGAYGDISDALNLGWQGAAGALGGAASDIKSAYGKGAGKIGQFIPAGYGAQQKQAALSGALGPQAQQAAMQAYLEGPEQAYLREMGERAVTRNASAMGGLGGGRVMQELQRQGQGLAAQDFQNSYNRLGMLSDQGLQAANNYGQLYGQMGNALGSLGQTGAGLYAGLGETGASLYGDLGKSRASLLGGLGQTGAAMMGDLGMAAGNNALNTWNQYGQNLAQLRTQAGRDIAGQVGGTSSALAELIAQQGSDIGNLINASGGNLAEIFQNLGNLSAEDQMNLMGMLAGISTGQGNQYASVNNVGSATPNNSMANWGALLSGIASVYGEFFN